MTRRLLASALAATLLSAAPAAAQTVTIKIGTLAPEGSPWHDALKEMNAKWQASSGGKVKLTIFGGGVQGDEAEMVRKMRIRQLQAGQVTSTGLQTIARELNALSIPLLFTSYDEIDYVRDRIGPRLKKALEDQGFIVLNWGDAGWVRFFSKTPAGRINELRAQKLFTWAGDANTEEMYKDAGFKPVPLAPTDILTSLQTGMIEAFPAPPTIALANQWFGLAKNMTDLKFAPIVGATIVSREAWEKIDPAVRPKLLQDAQDVGERLKGSIRKLEPDAIAAMQKRGLKVIPVPPDAEREWQQAAEKFYGRIRGELVQPRDFDEVMGLVKQYRASKAKGTEQD